MEKDPDNLLSSQKVHMEVTTEAGDIQPVVLAAPPGGTDKGGREGQTNVAARHEDGGGDQGVQEDDVTSDEKAVPAEGGEEYAARLGLGRVGKSSPTPRLRTRPGTRANVRERMTLSSGESDTEKKAESKTDAEMPAKSADRQSSSESAAGETSKGDTGEGRGDDHSQSSVYIQKKTPDGNLQTIQFNVVQVPKNAIGGKKGRKSAPSHESPATRAKIKSIAGRPVRQDVVTQRTVLKNTLAKGVVESKNLIIRRKIATGTKQRV